MKTFLSLLCCCLLNVTLAQITEAEYFIDTDPGIGNAEAITITNGQAISESFTASSSGLSNGIHTLYVRTKDINDNWSLYFNKTFRVRPSDTQITPTTIVDAEYFIDVDPGVGNGETISLTDGFIANETFNATTIGLSDGIHTLHIRTQDASGDWSLYFKKNFRVRIPTNNGMPTPIVAAEYFIDTDPGIGNALVIDITSGFNLDDTFTASIAGLDLGTHLMHVRVKDADNRWSIYAISEFEIATLGIEDNLLNTISIYPNPTKNFITINDTESNINTITIYSSKGELITTKKLLTHQVDISALSSGIYLLKLETANSSITKKIIKL